MKINWQLRIIQFDAIIIGLLFIAGGLFSVYSKDSAGFVICVPLGIAFFYLSFKVFPRWSTMNKDFAGPTNKLLIWNGCIFALILFLSTSLPVAYSFTELKRAEKINLIPVYQELIKSDKIKGLVKKKVEKKIIAQNSNRHPMLVPTKRIVLNFINELPFENNCLKKLKTYLFFAGLELDTVETINKKQSAQIEITIDGDFILCEYTELFPLQRQHFQNRIAGYSGGRIICNLKCKSKDRILYHYISTKKVECPERIDVSYGETIKSPKDELMEFFDLQLVTMMDSLFGRHLTESIVQGVSKLEFPKVIENQNPGLIKAVESLESYFQYDAKEFLKSKYQS